MADQKVKTTKNTWRRTEKELVFFVEVLAEPENTFAIYFEKLAHSEAFV